MPESTVTLSREQIDFFNEQGYLAIDAITSQKEIAHVRELYDRIFAQRAGREEGNQFDLAGTDEEGKQASLPQILNPSKYAPQLNDTQMLQNVLAIGQQLLGPEAQAAFAHAIFKPAKVGAETPWHQDAAYWNPQTLHRNISVWVPLQEATPENGCMHFVPGSQKLDILPHQSINNDPRIHGLELKPDQMYQTENMTACPLPPGGATLHGGYTLHYTPPNRSEIPRRAIILTIAAPGKKRDKPMRFPWLEEKQTARQKRADAVKS